MNFDADVTEQNDANDALRAAIATCKARMEKDGGTCIVTMTQGGEYTTQRIVSVGRMVSVFEYYGRVDSGSMVLGTGVFRHSGMESVGYHPDCKD